MTEARLQRSLWPGALSLYIVLALAWPAQAAVDAAQLRQAVSVFVQQQTDALLQDYSADARLEYRINHLDARLRLADCDVPLALDVKDLTPGPRLNVHVHCPGSARWAIYVPVEISIWQPIVVAATSIARGQTLTPQDLALAEHDVATLGRGYYSDPAALEGFIARRVLSARNPVLASQVEAPLQVKRGDLVIITAIQNGLQVKMEGIAERDGRYGDRIAVRNSQSRRIVEAQVIGTGRVQVLF